MKFIAEIGSNWNVPGESGLTRAKRLIGSAARSGATHAKFQLFRADLLYVKGHPSVDKLRPYELPEGWIEPLFNECNDCGVEFLCTPFYPGAVDLLYDYVGTYKVASWDITNAPLLDAVASTNLDVILSTGAATFQEIEAAIERLRPPYDGENVNDAGITLMHCTGGYPTKVKDMNLRRLLDIGAEFFPLDVGLSSHCLIPGVTAAATMYGAKVIECHYDLDARGIEAAHSYSPTSFAAMVAMASELEKALGECPGCLTEDDVNARNSYFRNPSDWLRPLKRD